MLNILEMIKYLMNPNEDQHFSYNILARVLCTEPYVQREHWGTHRGFDLDPILGEAVFVKDEELIYDSVVK